MQPLFHNFQVATKHCCRVIRSCSFDGSSDCGPSFYCADVQRRVCLMLLTSSFACVSGKRSCDEDELINQHDVVWVLFLWSLLWCVNNNVWQSAEREKTNYSALLGMFHFHSIAVSSVVANQKAHTVNQVVDLRVVNFSWSCPTSGIR